MHRQVELRRLLYHIDQSDERRHQASPFMQFRTRNVPSFQHQLLHFRGQLQSKHKTLLRCILSTAYNLYLFYNNPKLEILMKPIFNLHLAKYSIRKVHSTYTPCCSLLPSYISSSFPLYIYRLDFLSCLPSP